MFASRLFVVKETGRYGKGLFAKQFIPKGTIVEFICRKDGVYSKKEFARLSKKEREFVVTHEVMRPSGIYSKHCNKKILYDNHSCDANCLSAGKWFGIIVKDIKKGEEETSDYRADGDVVHFEGGCKCGKKNCMGNSTFRPPAPKKLRDSWKRKVDDAVRLIPTVKQPLKAALLKEHPELSYLFEKRKAE